MRPFLILFAFLSILLTGAIFGFFYAWVCSTLWGLDAADPKVAIAAMQAMNESVRNPVFAPAFFATPFVLLIAGGLALSQRLRSAGLSFCAAGLVYLLGGLVLTVSVNVPMNDALADVVIPGDPVEAARIWLDYSGEWQVWNQVRTVASGIALTLAAAGLFRLGRGAP